MLQAPVAVDHQARIGRERGRRIEAARKRARQLGDADVPGDVAGERGLVQAEPPQRRGDRPARMVADEKDRRRAFGIDDLEGRRVGGPEERGRCGRGFGEAHGGALTL